MSILDEIKDIDHQLEKAERTLNWNSSGNYWKNDVMVFDNNNISKRYLSFPCNFVSYYIFTKKFSFVVNSKLR